MALSQEQVSHLLDQVRTVEPDRLDCESCFEHMAEFAEAEMLGREVGVVLADVRRHLDLCKCCREEYALLLEGLKTLADESLDP